MISTTSFSDDMRTPLFERIIKNPPSWAYDKIQAWDINYLKNAQPFCVRHYWTANGSVNVFRIIGTSHQQYQDRTWLELLMSGKRMNINLPLQDKNPQYYFSTENKLPSMYFNTFDGINFYVGTDGNHRSCIAKFFFHELGITHLHGVIINHYDIHHEFFNIYHLLLDKIRLLNLPVTLTPKTHAVKREDTAGWMVDHFEPYLEWNEFDSLTQSEKIMQLDYRQAKEKLVELQSSPAITYPPQVNPILKRIKQLFNH